MALARALITDSLEQSRRHRSGLRLTRSCRGRELVEQLETGPEQIAQRVSRRTERSRSHRQFAVAIEAVLSGGWLRRGGLRRLLSEHGAHNGRETLDALLLAPESRAPHH